MAQQRFQQQHPQPAAEAEGMKVAIVEQRFDSSTAMTAALAAFSLPLIAGALQVQSTATLLLSGGRTPLPFYAHLAQQPLPWQRVQLALVDERWVPTTHAASNERALRQCFAGNDIALQNFTGMYNGALHAAQAVDACSQRYAALAWPATLAVLGMGSDGHTASLFPGATGLEAALRTRNYCAAIDAVPSASTGDCTERMTLSLHALLQCRQLVLLIQGDEKWQIYQRAKQRADSSLPISLLLQQTQAIQVFWSP